MADEYQRSDERGRHGLLGLRNRNQAFNPQTRPNLFTPVRRTRAPAVSPRHRTQSSAWRCFRMLLDEHTNLRGPGDANV